MRQRAAFTRIKFHHNRMQIKGPYLSCEVKTSIIISYGKLKMQRLKLAMSVVLGEKLNSWQSPNVLRRQHNYSKLMNGYTYKLVSKYLKLTVYLIAKTVTGSSYNTSKPFSELWTVVQFYLHQQHLLQTPSIAFTLWKEYWQKIDVQRFHWTSNFLRLSNHIFDERSLTIIVT